MNKLDDILEYMNCACSDGSCIFRPSTAKGLVTNGGCKVHEQTTYEAQIDFEEYIYR